MATRGRSKWSITAASAVLAVIVLAAPSYAQIVGDGSSTTESTTTTTSTTTLLPAETSTTTTAPPATTTPPGQEPPPGDPAPPEGADDGEAGDGDGDGGNITWGTVPPEAQKIIDSVVRTPPNSSQALYDSVQELVDLGLTREEAIRIGFGRFPIAGVAKYSHDWLFPRYGPGFRFHQGTDVFAPFGTPLRAVVDGRLEAKSSSLGGLTLKLFTDDGTYFYYAHLSALADGFVDGMTVETGDIIGYVGDSGNAKGGAPHLHIGVYPQGGAATDPKPLLDQFLADAAEALPGIVEEVRANARPSAPAPAPDTPRPPRSLLATSLLRPLTDRTASAEVSTEILYQTTANPTAGGASIARSEATDLAGSIDWEAWQTRTELSRDLLRRSEAVLRLALGDRVDRQTAVTETAGAG